MSGIAFAALLSTLATGQVEPGYWKQWNQYGPYGPGNVQFSGPGVWRNGQLQLPIDGQETWDWRLDPFARSRVQVLPRVHRPGAIPARQVPGRHYGPGGAVRQALDSLAPDSPTLVSYRKAIDAMRKLPPDDPHSLVFQSNIHGFPPTPNPDPLWGQCQHGNWWFLPWHRAYLHCFEKICRRYAEDPNFALPYWDYGVEAGRALPAAFRDPASPLYDDSRRATVNSGADQLSAAIVVDGLNASMGNTTFADFGPVQTFGGQAINAPQHLGIAHGALESVPHDLVHGFVGGNMGQVNMAGRDPLFAAHHANVDRYWVMWLQMGQGRANPANEAWLNQSFTFYDENKKQVNLTIRQVLDTSALGYTYDRLGSPAPTPTPAPTPPPPSTPVPTPVPTPPPPGTPSPTPVPTPPPPGTPSPTPAPTPPPPSTPAPQTAVETVATLSTSDVAVQGRPVTLTMTVPEQVRQKFRRRPTTRAEQQRLTNQLHLQIAEARFASGTPDSAIAVYINLPPNSPIPGPRSPYFAGYFTFFGDHHNHGYACRVDVSRQLLRLWQNDAQQRAEFTVTLVRTAPGTMPRDFRAPIRFKEMSLSATK